MNKKSGKAVDCFFVENYWLFLWYYIIGRNKDREERKMRGGDGYGFVHKENIESGNHICNFNCYIFCSVPDSFYVKLYTFKQYGEYDNDRRCCFLYHI